MWFSIRFTKYTKRFNMHFVPSRAGKIHPTVFPSKNLGVKLIMGHNRLGEAIAIVHPLFAMTHNICARKPLFYGARRRGCVYTSRRKHPIRDEKYFRWRIISFSRVVPFVLQRNSRIRCYVNRLILLYRKSIDISIIVVVSDVSHGRVSKCSLSLSGHQLSR